MAQKNKQVIIGGGETASLFVGLDAEHIYLSTGGGALLEHIQSVVMQTPTVPGLQLFAEFNERERRLSQGEGSPKRRVWTGSICN